MPFIPQSMRQKKIALENGEEASASVRAILGWFRAARRGYYVVERIRRALEAEGLTTEPDFESAYIDQLVYFVAKESLPPVVESVLPEAAPIEASIAPRPVDPSHRLGRLRAANIRPISVPPNVTLTAATTLLLTHDFSQLPVMQSEFSVKGIISWKSIGSRLALGQACATVQDCIEPHHELRDDASLFDAIRVIAEHDCVLVRDRSNKVSGLVTAADISEQFHLLAEPFLLLGEIENRIRALITLRFDIDDLQSAKNPEDTDREIADVADLTFGEYVRLLEHPERWEKFAVKVERGQFVEQLGLIRDIRNDVMHFDPDGISEEALSNLRRFGRFLDRLQQITS